MLHRVKQGLYTSGESEIEHTSYDRIVNCGYIDELDNHQSRSQVSADTPGH